MATKTPALEHSYDPLVSVTEHYTIIHEMAEEERSPAVTDMIANNGVEAIANAMVLAKPYAGEVFTATWYDCDGEQREITLKVLARK